ncbi:hypothetical protein ACHWQZ_G008290 [Mnemiopsis leidyi]
MVRLTFKNGKTNFKMRIIRSSETYNYTTQCLDPELNNQTSPVQSDSMLNSATKHLQSYQTQCSNPNLNIQTSPVLLDPKLNKETSSVLPETVIRSQTEELNILSSTRRRVQIPN